VLHSIDSIVENMPKMMQELMTSRVPSLKKRRSVILLRSHLTSHILRVSGTGTTGKKL